MNNPLLARIPSIFPRMARNFELLRVGPKPSGTKSGGFFGTDDSQDEATTSPVPMCEPIVPESQAQKMEMGNGGSYTTYDYEWWSTTDYPQGTLIRYDGIKLEVVKIEPYWHDGGFAIYYLQNRSDA